MSAWQAALGFFLVAVGVVLSLLLVGGLLRVKSRRGTSLGRRTYECGEEPAGPAWMQFHARYYVVALFFVLFDVEAVFLFPWGAANRALGVEGLVAVATFVVVLMLGWLYGLRRGALRWQ